MTSRFLPRSCVIGGVLAGASLAAAPFGCFTSAGLAVGGAGGITLSSVGGGDGGIHLEIDLDAPQCRNTCSNDLRNVVDCLGNVLSTCGADQGCASGACVNDPCHAATVSKSSYGCDYWALKTAQRPQADGACFAVFIANTWPKPVQIRVERDSQLLPVASFAGIPSGQGPSLTYAPYDPVQGLDVGKVAILFLSRKTSGGSTVVNCPIPAALDEETGVAGTGIGTAFHITTDYPVVAYQIDPFGGAQTAVTSATLLLPASAWDTNYLAVGAYPSAEPTVSGGNPSINILAATDQTTVTLLPNAEIVGGAGVPAGAKNTAQSYTLNAGQFLQITQPAELTGSPILASNPVAVFGGSACMEVPVTQMDCDSAQQQIPPVRALGREYVGVRYRGRGGGQNEAPPWRLLGAANGTALTWEPGTPQGAPTALDLGQVVEFAAPGPFVVKSQDTAHPFYLGAYMTGGAPFSGEGDPDWVNVITPSQFLTHYVFFTDPTYPETNLVIVRAPSRTDGAFADVTLDCAGGGARVLGGFQPVGGYEFTRVDLSTGNFQSVAGCSNGRQEITSSLPFGVTVWGWGNTEQTKYVSYAYPAGAGFQPINQVFVPTAPH